MFFIYLYSFALYLCVDVCYNLHNVPYNTSALPSDASGSKEVASLGKLSDICRYCFNMWNLSPIGNASGYTRFYFLSRETGLNYTEIVPGNVTSFSTSGFDLNKETKLLIHGWLDTGFTDFSAETRDAYLIEQDVNIITVDWSPLASMFYPIARVAVNPVGRYVAQFLDWLVSQTGLSINSIHIVGHSLGAHIAGVTGEHISNGPLSRISGLDPAGPGFNSERAGRLDPSDALFVDVIHTAGLWLGYYDASGHVDFYPNGGTPNQPGCPIDFGKCSHIRSYKLFAESISNEDFISKACDSWRDYTEGRCHENTTAVMGEHVNQSVRGKFYLHTSSQPPYALGNVTTSL